MGVMTFLVNDALTSGSAFPSVWVTLEELEDALGIPDGRIRLTVRVEGSMLGDLRGVFFDLADEGLIGSLQATGAHLTQLAQEDDAITDLGNGATMNGLLGSSGSDTGYDVGLEIGTPGMSSDDIWSFSADLSSSLRGLTLADFAGVDFGVRLTSVGTTSRDGSSKLLETTFTAITPADDSATVLEDQSYSGDLLSNDLAGLDPDDVVRVTQWEGGDLNTAVTLQGTFGATLLVHGDGSYVLDAAASDPLSEGEVITLSFDYEVQNTNEVDSTGTPTAWSTDKATLTVVVTGVNDPPVAGDDDGGSVAEDETATGGVLDNDGDIDHQDQIRVTGIRNLDGEFILGSSVELESGAIVTMAADGTYSYDPNGSFDDLDAEEFRDDHFVYQITDNHGATTTATVTIRVTGEDDGGSGGSVLSSMDFPTMQQAISNVVLYLAAADAHGQIIPSGTVSKVKVEPATGLALYDVDDLHLQEFLDTHVNELGGPQVAIAISIHAGQEYPNREGWDGTAPGEGVFFLLEDDTPIAPVGHRQAKEWVQYWSADDYGVVDSQQIWHPLSPEALALGLTTNLLLAQAPRYEFDGAW